MEVGGSVSCTPFNLNNPDCDADNARLIAELAPQVARYKDSRSALGSRQLLPGRVMRSENRRYRFVYQTDGNLVLYDDRDGTALWTSQTAGNPNAYFVIQDDGNLVIYSADGRPIWSRMQDAASASRR
jgi:hypothetical protein